MRDRPPAREAVTLLKLGGSLLTDKRQADSVREDVLRRIAGEVAEAAGIHLILGHGSGSFGHAAAERFGVHRGLEPGDRPTGVPSTQERAAALHRRVFDALADAGLLPYSVAPSSALVADGGHPAQFTAEPVALALAAGLLPLVYGDVVMDRRQGCAICSTEHVFLALQPALADHGVAVKRVLWAGATPGVLDTEGRTIRRITPLSADAAVTAAAGAEGTDVTGGMAHRLEAAVELARRGIPSLVFDGTVPGHVASALRGDGVPGTEVRPDTAPGA